MSDTPTPRTDNAIQRCACADYIIEPAFARQLERELAAAHERIRRLAAAGDAFVSAESVEQYVLAEENWTKAKDAKT